MAKTITKLSIAVGSALFATIAAGLAPAQAALLNLSLNTVPAPGNGSLDPVTFTLDTSKLPSPAGGNTHTYSGAISNLKFDNLATLPGPFDLQTSAVGNQDTYTVVIPGTTNNQLFFGFTGATPDNGLIGSLTTSSFNNVTNITGLASTIGTNQQLISNEIKGIVVGAGPSPSPSPNPITTVPESNPTASLLALGALGAGATLLRKMSKKASLTTV